MSIQITVNPLASLENILEKISNVTNGQVEFSVVRKNLVKSEVKVSVHPQKVVEYVPVYAPKLKPQKASKYRGVTKFRGHYRARIAHENKTILIGMFKNEIDAARAYNKVATELKGDNAILNIIDVDTPIAN